MQVSWQKLETAFLSQFALVVQKEMDHTWFLNLISNFRQRGQSVVKYIRKGDQLNTEYPKKFPDMLGHQFIAKLDDKRKIDLVQVYLRNGKLTVKYSEAK